MRDIFMLAVVVAIGVGGIALARHAFTNGIQTVIASEASAPSPVATSPMPTWDSTCSLSPFDRKPGNANRCHSEMMWAREQTAAPYVQSAPPIPTMSKDNSARTALWFGAAMLAGLFALGAIGAGAMYVLRE